MATTPTNPYASFTPEQREQVAIKFHELLDSGKLNEKQMQGVRNAFTQLRQSGEFPTGMKPMAKRTATEKAIAEGSPTKARIAAFTEGVTKDVKDIATNPLNLGALAISAISPVARGIIGAGTAALGVKGLAEKEGASWKDTLKAVPQAFGIGDLTVNPDEVQKTMMDAAMIPGGIGAMKGTAKPTAQALRKYARNVEDRFMRVGPEQLRSGDTLDRVNTPGKQTGKLPPARNIDSRITQLDDVIKQGEAAIDATAQQAQQAGVKHDLVQPMANAFGDFIKKQMAAGNRNAVEMLLREMQQTTEPIKFNPQTGQLQVGNRNMRAVDPVDALMLKRAMQDRAFQAGGNRLLQDVFRKAQFEIAQQMARDIPQLQELNLKTSAAIRGKEALEQRWETRQKIGDRIQSWFAHDGIGDMAFVTALTQLGMQSGVPLHQAIPGALALRTLYKSTPSVTTRSYLANRLADLLDRPTPPGPMRIPGQAQGGPGAGGGGVQGRPLPPQGPTGGGGGGAAPTLAPAPASPAAAPSPTGPAVGAPVGPVSSAVPRQLPAPQFVGSQAGAAADTANVKAAIQEVGKPVSQMSAAELSQVLQKAQALKEAGQAPKVTPTVQRIPEGVSGLSPEMQQRFAELDAAIERVDNSDTAMGRSAANKTLRNIKEAIAASTEPEAKAALVKRLKAAERKRRSRAQGAQELAAEDLGMVEGATKRSFEAVSPEAPIDEVLHAQAEIYGHISKMPEGGTYVKALKKAAKDAKFDAYMEYQAALEAFEALKELESQGRGSVGGGSEFRDTGRPEGEQTATEVWHKANQAQTKAKEALDSGNREEYIRQNSEADRLWNVFKRLKDR